MTDQQLTTLALAIIIPLSLLLYSNSRITDAKEVLRAEMQKNQAELLARFAALEAAIESKLKIHELEHHR